MTASAPCEAYAQASVPCLAQGTGTVEGTGTLYGQGRLDGWAEMVAATGTWQGPLGVCGGPTAA